MKNTAKKGQIIQKQKNNQNNTSSKQHILIENKSEQAVDNFLIAQYDDVKFGDEKVDVLESRIQSLSPELLAVLLKDRTTGKNIIWATSNYIRYDNHSSRVKKFGAGCEIKAVFITDKYEYVIKPRTTKAAIEQKKRVKEKAEVFTPSWICNAQNNLIDDNWLGYENAFNFEVVNTTNVIENGKTVSKTVHTWTVNTNKIDFSKSNKQWQDYIIDTRLEITCGEAPYLVSRYDTVTGEVLDIDKRIGMIDRKIRVINENVGNVGQLTMYNMERIDSPLARNDSENIGVSMVSSEDYTLEKEWFEWVKKAYQSIYGYEWQGDSVLIARGNLLYTFRDYYKKRFNKEPAIEMQLEIAEIISWNIWQMDGLKFVVPNSCTYQTVKKEPEQATFFENELFENELLKNKPKQESQLELCEGCKKGNYLRHNGIYCNIKDWSLTVKKQKIRFVDCLDKDYKSGGKR